MVQIIADTLSSIPVDEAKKLNLPYLPQIVIFGEESFRDDSEISPDSFFEKLKTSRELPKTAAPYPTLYKPIFTELIKNGDPILVICPSSKVSGTVRSAEVAAQDFPDADIRILDTPILGAGLGVVVRKALAWAKDGNSIETIINKVNELANKNRTYFLVDTLEYLQRGGRIGAAQALLGEILQVKPILAFRNGQVEPLEKQRTRNKAFERFIEIISQECPHNDEANLCIQHGGAEKEAIELVDKLKEITGIKQIPIYPVPPAILVHGGPGVLGVSFFVI